MQLPISTLLVLLYFKVAQPASFLSILSLRNLSTFVVDRERPNAEPRSFIILLGPAYLKERTSSKGPCQSPGNQPPTY